MEHREREGLPKHLNRKGAGPGAARGRVMVIGRGHRGGDLLDRQRAALGAHLGIALEAGHPGQRQAGEKVQVLARAIPVVEQDKRTRMPARPARHTSARAKAFWVG